MWPRYRGLLERLVVDGRLVARGFGVALARTLGAGVAAPGRSGAREGSAAVSGGVVIAEEDTRRPPRAGPGFAGIELPGNAKILAATYFPERLPSQYLRRWRA